jgi:hypothetical protein
MRQTYGSEKKAKQVFYSSIKAGKIIGAERSESSHRKAVGAGLRHVALKR